MTDPERPLVSVVLTFFNQENYVRRAVGSLLSQTYERFEIIVVDDGSTDGTAEEVRKVDDARITFISKGNGGVSSARNRGIAEASGQFIAFLDGDDAYLPTKIEVLIERLAHLGFPVCAMVSGYYEVSAEGQLTSVYRQQEWVTDPQRDPVSAFPNMRPSMVIYHQQVFEQLGGFPEDLQINEDGAFNLRVLRTYPIHCIPELLVLWQGDDEGKSRNVLQDYQTAYQTMENKVAYLSRWIGDADAVVYRKLHIRNNLCGFLSIGRLDIARQWVTLVKKHEVPLDTIAARLAYISVKCRVNIYSCVRVLIKQYHAVELRKQQVQLTDQLLFWCSSDKDRLH